MICDLLCPANLGRARLSPSSHSLGGGVLKHEPIRRFLLEILGGLVGLGEGSVR